MPAYDYKCTACSRVFEIVRPPRADAAIPCPACGAATKQVFHAVGVHFKGSGFHNTDYRKEEAAPAEKPAAAESAPCEAAGSTSACGECPAAG
jgi:putative FmdB family regulatory protein